MSCNNNSKTEGISLHIFPRNKFFLQPMDLLRSATSRELETIKDICTLFGTFRVGQRADLNLKETEDTSLFKSRRWLKKDAVPSIDCAAVVHVCIAPFRRIARRKFAI